MAPGGGGVEMVFIEMVADKNLLPTGFYTRKVKYTQETFCEKFQAILDGFPRLQDIHPFRKQSHLN